MKHRKHDEANLEIHHLFKFHDFAGYTGILNMNNTLWGKWEEGNGLFPPFPTNPTALLQLFGPNFKTWKVVSFPTNRCTAGVSKQIQALKSRNRPKNSFLCKDLMIDVDTPPGVDSLQRTVTVGQPGNKFFEKIGLDSSKYLKLDLLRRFFLPIIFFQLPVVVTFGYLKNQRSEAVKRFLPPHIPLRGPALL